MPNGTYTHLEKWFDAVTAAVRHSVPGIFDDVDLKEAYKQLKQLLQTEERERESPPVKLSSAPPCSRKPIPRKQQTGNSQG